MSTFNREKYDTKKERLITLEEGDECNISGISSMIYITFNVHLTEDLLDSDEAVHRNYLEVSPISSASKVTFQKVFPDRVFATKR